MTETGSQLENGKLDEIHRAANHIFHHSPDWTTFYREVLGLHGIVRRHCPTPDALAEFERTEAYAKIQQMLASLRARRLMQATPLGETRVITVRLPRSLHEALKVEAHEYRTSMNKLCISKLLQFIDSELVPEE